MQKITIGTNAYFDIGACAYMLGDGYYFKRLRVR